MIPQQQTIILDKPGEFCIDAGDTVEIIANASAQSQSITDLNLEVTRNGVIVAKSSQTDEGGFKFGSASIIYKETVAVDSQFAVRVSLLNAQPADDEIVVCFSQVGVKIFEGGDVTNANLNNC